MKFRDRVAAFLYGRNGTDELYTFLMWVALSMTVIGWIFQIAGLRFVGLGLYGLGLVVLWYGFFRFLSRNLSARRRENQAYLKRKRAAVGFLRLQRHRFRDRKTHIYRRCPHCGVTLRLPKEKGTHPVCCPKCTEHFEVKVGGNPCNRK